LIIYNVTINIDDSIHEQWFYWMQEKHIKAVLATGKFIKAKFIQVLTEQPTNGITYCVQYFAKDKSDLENYYLEDAQLLREEGLKLFGDKMLTFRTELKVLSEIHP